MRSSEVTTDAELAAGRRLAAERAPGYLEHLAAVTTGTIRHCVGPNHLGDGGEDRLLAVARAAAAADREHRVLYPLGYPLGPLHAPAGLSLVGVRAMAGGVQRVRATTPGEFIALGLTAVLAAEGSGDSQPHYLVVRHPVVVQAFVTLFDLAWADAFPPPSGRDAPVGDEQLLELMGRGLKDEAIARHLGWSLRTVRRRVASLMDRFGTATRFQLGADAAHAGALAREPAPTPGVGQAPDWGVGTPSG